MLEKLKNENLANGVSQDTLNQISVYLSILAIIISIVSMVIA